MHVVVLLLVTSSVLQQPQTPDTNGAAAGPTLPPAFVDVRQSQRPRVIEYTHAYDVRLKIHKYASYATLPLFVAEAVLGQQLYNNPPGSSSTLQAHQMVALGVAGLFAVNTVTGVWNLWDSRKNPEGRLKRWIHGSLMIVSDAGFVATGATAPSRRSVLSDPARAQLHRTIAITSIGAALAGYGMMLLWKN